jgi:hypothetical protein
MCLLLAQLIIGFFLLPLFMVLMKQTRQAVRAIKQSIFLDVYENNKHAWMNHRHLSNIDCLTVQTACLVCFISTVNGRNEEEALKDWR